VFLVGKMTKDPNVAGVAQARSNVLRIAVTPGLAALEAEDD